MASNRGRKRTSTEFPSGQVAKKMAEYCTVSEGPEEGMTYNTDINRSGVPLKELANPMTIVYPIKIKDFGSPLYRRILYTWGLPNALRSGLRKYRHWTEEDIESHLSFLHGPLNKIILKVGDGFSWERKFTEEQIKNFEETIVLKDRPYQQPPMQDVIEKWKQNKVIFPTCSTHEGNVKYRQILLHSGLTFDFKKKLGQQGLTPQDIDNHLLHMQSFFRGVTISVQKAANKRYTPARLPYREFPASATGALLSDVEDETEREIPMQPSTSQDITPTIGPQPSSQENITPRRVETVRLGPVRPKIMSKEELSKRGELRTKYLAWRKARVGGDQEELKKLTADLGDIKIDMYDSATAEIESRDLGDDITNTWIALTEFVCTYECLVALLSNIEDQIQMHRCIRKARDYLEMLEADNAVLPIELQSEIDTFLSEQQAMFDDMEVNQNIGAKGLASDLKIKQEIIGHFMSIAYPEEEVAQEDTEPCEYDYMTTYYGTFGREELVEAQTQISEQMDVIDQEFITRPAVARGATRYRDVGTGDDDDDNHQKGTYDEETEVEDVNEEENNNQQEITESDNLIIMNPNNGTGLQIKNVISVEPMEVDQPKVQEPPEKLKRAVIAIDKVDSPQFKDPGATPVPERQPVLEEQPVPQEDPMAAKQPVPEEDPPFVPRVKQTARKSTKQKQTPQKSKKDKKTKKGSGDEEPTPSKPKKRTSIRLAGEEAQELKLPKHITPKKDKSKAKPVPVNPANIMYSRGWTPLFFTARPHPRPSLPQVITGGKKTYKSIATQVVEPLKPRRRDTWRNATQVELDPGEDEFVRAPLFRTKDTTREQLINKVQAAAKKERAELIKRGIQPYSASKITVLDKRHNFKPGALALAEIRHYQNVEGLILSPTVMKRLCLEIARELNPNFQFEGLAYRLLHKASEEYLMRIYRDCAMVASLNNKVTVDERDMLVVRRISGDYGKYDTWGTGYQHNIQPERVTEDEAATAREGYKSQFAQWKADWAEKKASRKQSKDQIKKK